MPPHSKYKEKQMRAIKCKETGTETLKLVSTTKKVELKVFTGSIKEGEFLGVVMTKADSKNLRAALAAAEKKLKK